MKLVKFIANDGHPAYINTDQLTVVCEIVDYNGLKEQKKVLIKTSDGTHVWVDNLTLEQVVDKLYKDTFGLETGDE